MRQFLIVCTVLLGHTAVVAADPLARRDGRSYLSNGSITIAGTLSLPAGRGPFSTVVLLSGSGPQNRDSEVSGFRPFKLMADFFVKVFVAPLLDDIATWIAGR